MAGIVIFLTVSVIIAFILTRDVIINVKKKERFTVEIHFPLIALILTTRKKGDKDKRSLSYKTYRRLFSDIARFSERSEIIIRNVGVGNSNADFNQNTTLRPYRIHSLISAAIAYLSERAQKLTLEGGALDYMPDNIGFTLDISAKTSIINAAFGILRVTRTISKAKRVRS